MRAEYRIEPCKSALTQVRGMPFRWSLNPYMGCAHRCTFCYVRQFTSIRRGSLPDRRATHWRRARLTLEAPRQYGYSLSWVDARGERDGVRNRASLSGRYTGAVRSEPRGGTSWGRSAGWPDLPRSWSVGWWLDGCGRPRLQGELGAVPRRHPDARMQAGIEGGLPVPPQELRSRSTTCSRSSRPGLSTEGSPRRALCRPATNWHVRQFTSMEGSVR